MMIKKAWISLICIVFIISAPIYALGYESMTYLYGGSTNTYLYRMEKTQGSINTVCPDYFEVNESGAIVFSKTPDPMLISAMQKQRVSVTPFLSNHWNRENARKMLANPVPAVQKMVDAVSAYGFDGLNIDIQNIVETDKGSFTNFIILLRKALPKSKSLTVCVPANPYNTTSGWQGGYDYAQLGKNSDCLFIMTYDESYTNGPPGPVASYWFIEESIKYGLKYVDKSKLMMGIPFYGRSWGGELNGTALTWADIEGMIGSSESKVWYDTKKECARATITIGAGKKFTTWGGRVVGEGEYDVWYDDKRSYQKKLDLVSKYGIRGVGSWALGQENTDIWNDYSGWLNGYPFKDIRNHWAQSYILDLYNKNVVSGRSRETFVPEGYLTRAEAATMLVKLSGVKLETTGYGFTDAVGHWAENYIRTARKIGIVEGVSKDRFEPDRYVTREEFTVLAERYTNIEDTIDFTQRVFEDVSPGNNPWSNKAIIKMTVNKVISGFPDGLFRPKEAITRAQAAKVMSLTSKLPTRFLGYTTLPIEKPQMGPR